MVPDLIELSTESWDTVTKLDVEEDWEPPGVDILRSSVVSGFPAGFKDFGDELSDLSDEFDPNMLFHSAF